MSSLLLTEFPFAHHDGGSPFNATIEGKLSAGLSDLPTASILERSRQMIYFTFLTNTPIDGQKI